MTTLVFSHANGFPAGTYRKLFQHWRDAGLAVHAVEKFGHDPRFPVTSNWPHLRNELLQLVEREATEPVFLVGHSLGGYLSLLAAIKRPELVRGVVMLDSPLIYGIKAHGVYLFKATGWIGNISPGKISRQRRTTWASAEEAYAHFAAKPNFARWDPEVLRDYIASGTEGHDSQHRLVFKREIETDIYNSIPHHMEALLARHPLSMPVAFIAGTTSDEVRQVGMYATKRLTKGRITWIEGGHLYPFEKPIETADTVLHWVREFEAAAEQVPAGRAA